MFLTNRSKLVAVVEEPKRNFKPGGRERPIRASLGDRKGGSIAQPLAMVSPRLSGVLPTAVSALLWVMIPVRELP